MRESQARNDVFYGLAPSVMVDRLMGLPGRGRYPRRMSATHDVGEKPGIGRYCCTNCDWSVRLDQNSDRLPPCGNCGKGQNTKYRKC